MTGPLKVGVPPVAARPLEMGPRIQRLPRPLWFLVAAVVVAIMLRTMAAAKPGLWADEIFSLAMATGHSLEHPALEADPSLGDFVEPPEAESPAVFRRYAEQEEPPADARRVIRAVLLSDTSPPVYYLLLNLWTRGFGTGDAALRLFSVWWAVLALPLLWLLGQELGGSRAARTACLLFSFSPVAIYYSVEARMYSLLWVLGLGLAWLTLRLGSGSSRPRHAVLWIMFGAAGLLTHYFFAFVWLSCLAWLGLRGRAPLARRAAVLASITLLAVLPWYLEVPASMARWRITGGWLNGELGWPGALWRPFALAGGLLSGTTFLGGWRWADKLAIALFVLLAIAIARQGSLRRMFSGPTLLLWGWLAAACVGPLVFDLLRHTTTTNVSRYVLPGLPPAMLLAALSISHLSATVHAAFLSTILLAWLPGVRATVLGRVPRPWEPYTKVAARLDAWGGPDDIVLVRSIPSGVVGVARYMKGDIPLAAWVTQLGARQVPADVERLLRGRRRVAVASIHALSAAGPLEQWLQAHARPLGHDTFKHSSATVLYFGPEDGSVFFPESSPSEGPAGSGR